MKTLSSRTLIATALLSVAAAVSATALPSPSNASMADAHSLPVNEPMHQPMSQHMAQHLAQRTHIAANVMHLAQASQAAPVEPPPARTAPQGSEQTPEVQEKRHGKHHGMHHGHHHGMKDGAQPGSHREHMQARRAAHHESLKAKLQLTPEQEPAWLAFTARMEAGVGPGRKPSGERVDWSKLTTPQRLDQMQARMVERQNAMTQRFDAIKSFYAALSPEQQKVFDTHHMGGHQRTSMKGHGSEGERSHQHRHHHHQGGMGADNPAQPQS